MGPNEPTAPVAAADDGKPSGEVRVWDLKTGQVKAHFASRMGPVYQVVFSPDGKLLAVAERNGPRPLRVAGRIRLVDPQTGEEKAVLLGHTAEICGLAFSPDGRFLASTGQDHLMRIWQMLTLSLRCLQFLGPLQSNKVTFSRRGDRAASITGLVHETPERYAQSNHPTVWEFEHALRGPRSIVDWLFSEGITSLRFSRDGGSLAVYGRKFGSWIYDTADWSARSRHCRRRGTSLGYLRRFHQGGPYKQEVQVVGPSAVARAPGI